MKHPSIGELRSTSPEMQQHLASCADCRRLVELLGAVARPSRALVDVPTVDRALFADWEELADARGGMGRLFRAWDRRLGRHVAIKQIRPAATVAQEQVQVALVRRLEHEARLTARLQHPSIVAVYEVGRFSDGELFYAMPLVRGRPLSREIAARGTLAARLALLPQLTAVAEAVAYSHEEGVIHRDLKPDNILVGTFGEAVVIDWGLAKSLAEVGREPAPAEDVYRAADDGLTQLGAGTPHYMSPEQGRGEGPSRAMDVYALGATLYHTLAGEPPYGTSDTREVRRRLQAEPPPPLVTRVPDVPAELSHICERAMARDAAARYANARELADELRRFQTGRLLQSRRYTLAELVSHFVRRHKALLSVAAAALALLAGLGVFAAINIRRQRDRAEDHRRGAERALRRAEGVIATRLAPEASRRLEALALGVRAVGPELAAGVAPAAEGLQGLLDALAAGPAAAPLEHGGAVTSFAVSPDGSLFAGAGDDRTVDVWDARSGRRRARFASEQERPYHVQFSPAGERLAVWGGAHAVELFTLATGERRAIALLHPPAGCELGADGSLVVAADDVAIYDAASGALRTRLPLPVPARRLAVAGARIAVAGADGSLHVGTTRGDFRLVATGGGVPASLTFDGSGDRLLYADADGRLRLFTAAGDGFAAATLPVQSELASRNAQARFSPDARFASVAYWSEEEERSLVFDVARAALVSGSAGFVQAWADGDRYWADARGAFNLVDAHDGGLVLALAGHRDEIKAAVWLGDGVASASRDGDELLWDLRGGEASGLLLGHSGEIVSALPSPAGDRLVTAGRDGSVRVWSLPDGRAEDVWRTSSALAGAVWSSDGRRVVAGARDGSVRVFTRGGGARVIWRAGGPIVDARFFPDGTRLVAGALDGQLAIVAADGSSVVPLRAGAGAVTALAVAPAGAGVVSAHGDGSARLWDAASGAERARLGAAEAVDEPNDREGYSAIVFAGDGRALLCRPSGTTAIVDGRDLHLLGTLAGRAAGAASRALSPDGGRYAAALPDGSVAVHDLAAGTHVSLRGHAGIVLATAFSSDGRLLVTGGLDGTVRVWDVTTGGPLAQLDAAFGPATAVAFGHDGRFVVAGYRSGALRELPATPAAALARACATLRRFDRLDGELSSYCAPERTVTSEKRSAAR